MWLNKTNTHIHAMKALSPLSIPVKFDFHVGTIAVAIRRDKVILSKIKAYPYPQSFSISSARHMRHVSDWILNAS